MKNQSIKDEFATVAILYSREEEKARGVFFTGTVPGSNGYGKEVRYTSLVSSDAEAIAAHQKKYPDAIVKGTVFNSEITNVRSFG